MLTVAQIAAIVVGAFYVFAGVVVLRAMALDRVMNQLLAALNDPSAPQEVWRSRVLTVGAFLTLASGAALMLLSPLALLFFAASAAWQGGYLLWAERALPPEDDGEARGRRQTKNAFVVYVAATAFVVWLAAQGHLRAWDVPVQTLGVDAAIVALVCVAFWAFLNMPRKEAATDEVAVADTGDGEREASMPARLRVAREWGCSPLWDDDIGEPVSIYALGLTLELADRIQLWDNAWQATYNADDPKAGGFASDEAREAHAVEGRAIVAALREALPGVVVLAESALEPAEGADPK